MKTFNLLIFMLFAFACSTTSQTLTLPACDTEHKDVFIKVCHPESGAFTYEVRDWQPIHADGVISQTVPGTAHDLFKDYEPFAFPDQLNYQTTEYKYNSGMQVEKPPLDNSKDLTISNTTAKPYFVNNEIVKPSTKVPVVNTQNPGEVIDSIKKAKSWQDLVNIETGLMSLLMLLGGYLSWLIPGIKSIPNTTYRVLAVAVLIVAGCFTIGFGEIWQGALAYLFSTSLYEVIFKLFKRSPRPPLAPDTPAYS